MASSNPDGYPEQQGDSDQQRESELGLGQVWQVVELRPDARVRETDLTEIALQ
jgi:hypothetical protein